jgi:hypothetical protein
MAIDFVKTPRQRLQDDAREFACEVVRPLSGWGMADPRFTVDLFEGGERVGVENSLEGYGIGAEVR